MSENTLYQADISSENFQTKIYYGISESKFKTRYSNDKKSSNHEQHKNDTQLSNEPWKTKASKEEPVIVWKILGQYRPYNVNTKRCLLCLNEKLQFAAILCDVYSTHVFTIIHVDTFHGSKGDFPVTCAVTSFKIRNLYIVVILAVIVHLPELVIYMYIRIYIYVYIYIYIYIYI